MTDPKALTAEREAFEKWALREGYGDLAQEGDRNEFGIDPVYRDPRVHAAWYAWQERATRGEPVAWRVDASYFTKLASVPIALRANAAPLYAAPVEPAGSPESSSMDYGGGPFYGVEQAGSTPDETDPLGYLMKAFDCYREAGPNMRGAFEKCARRALVAPAPDETLQEALAALEGAKGWLMGWASAEPWLSQLEAAIERINRALARTPDETLREALAEAFMNGLSWMLANRDSRLSEWKQVASDYARRALATPTKPEMQPEGLVSSCQALSETAGEPARKSEVRRPTDADVAKLLAWVGEAVEYVNSKAMNPTLERTGRALLYRRARDFTNE